MKKNHKEKRILPLWKIILPAIFCTGKGIASLTLLIILLCSGYQLDILGNTSFVTIIIFIVSVISFSIVASNLIQDIVIIDILYNDNNIHKEE